MPDSNSLYASPGAPQVLELLRHQLVSVSEDRRRVMLWSAILAVGSLMLLGKVASIPWFLALVPLALLALWQACLLVRQRRCQAAWDSVLQKSENGAGPNAISKASALAASSVELGARDMPDLLGALASPSVLVFHGLLLSAVIAGGATHEMSHGAEATSSLSKTTAKASSGGGGGCGCGGGSGERAVVSTELPTRSPNAMPPRNFSNVPQRPGPNAPQPVAYPTRPSPPVGQPGDSARNPAPGVSPTGPVANPRNPSPLPNQSTASPGVGAPVPPPTLAPGPVTGGAPAPMVQPPNPRQSSPAQPTAPASAPAGSAKPE